MPTTLRAILLAVAILLFGTADVCFPAQRIIYVDDAAAGGGDGSSWQNAYRYLQDALEATGQTGPEDPVEIRVAQGTYQPDRSSAAPNGNGDRDASFLLAAWTTVKGGFAGTVATDPDTCDPNLYKTVLSGDLAGDDTQVSDPCELVTMTCRSDNSYNVVYLRHVEHTTLDGFTITGAHVGLPNFRTSSAGGESFTITGGHVGLLPASRGGPSSVGGAAVRDANEVTIANCVFSGNDTSAGAALNLNDCGGVQVINCLFTQNIASQWYGGGMYINRTDLMVRGCTFTGNVAPRGGGAYVDGWYWENKAVAFVGCRFHENLACERYEWATPATGMPNGEGGGLFLQLGVTLERCEFFENLADYCGGGVACRTPFYTESGFVECRFIRNRAKENGGGISAVYDGTTRLRDCTFEGNVSGGDGGALKLGLMRETSLYGCSFESNTSGRNGGAVYVYGYSWDGTIIKGCRFRGNRAAVSGGGIAHSAGVLTVTNCLFSGNSAVDGGGLRAGGPRTWTLTNTVFAGNRVDGFGAAIASDGIPAIGHCTFHANSSQAGGAMAFLEGTPRPSEGWFMIANCIMRDGGSEVTNNSGHRMDLFYSNVQGGWPGAGNVDVDPCFIEPGRWDPNGEIWIDGDYHLQSEAGRWDPVGQGWVHDDVTSPCIDAGDPYSSYDRELWPHGRRANMGAHGNTAEASLSTSQEGNIADLDNNTIVTLHDFGRLAQRWLSQDLLSREDLNRDGCVDAGDLQILSEQWLADQAEVSFVDYWPLTVGARWSTQGVVDWGSSMEVEERFSVNGFAVSAIRSSWVSWIPHHSEGSRTIYYVYVNGGLYKTFAKANLDRLPDISSGFSLESPEVIKLGESFLHGEYGWLTPIRVSLREFASRFLPYVLSYLSPQEQPWDVLVFTRADGTAAAAFGRHYGPLLRPGYPMKRYNSTSQ
jgi:predicted outer membrane repeat protein